jgi:hypothetical protein
LHEKLVNGQVFRNSEIVAEYSYDQAVTLIIIISSITGFGRYLPESWLLSLPDCCQPDSTLAFLSQLRTRRVPSVTHMFTRSRRSAWPYGQGAVSLDLEN